MIYTFYSYKGGVGRSMALANVADSLARKGLRVLMIDFDLEAPGLEQFFQIDHDRARRREGLLDLLLSYKQSMSVAGGDGDQDPYFMGLQENFILPVYDTLPSGGRLDLMPAGQRGDQSQLARYAYGLRTFDWQDFYYNWAGETFFEWLRTSLVPGLYDVVLVDSRTGVTEMGGICAYQLADTIVMFCASNHQNVEGTLNLVENFFSDRVQKRRQFRPLQVLVVPSRVEQDDPDLLAGFHERFAQALDEYTPEPLRRAGLSFWDLMIPYDPRYAFEERVITQPSRAEERRQMVAAYQVLVNAITRLAELESALHALGTGDGKEQAKLVEPQYDVTRRSASYQAFLSYESADEAVVERISRRLEEESHLDLLLTRWSRMPGDPWPEKLHEAVGQSHCAVIFIGPAGLSSKYRRELRKLLDQTEEAIEEYRSIPVLLPGSSSEAVPGFLADRVWVDFRSGLDDAATFTKLVDGIRGVIPAPVQTTIVYGNPYRGLSYFDEEHTQFFFGRESLIEELVNRLRDSRFLAVIGASGSGKTSVARAGLLPRLRQGALPASDRWPIAVVRPGSHPFEALAVGLRVLLDDPADIDSLTEKLSSSESGLSDLVRMALDARADSSCLLLVVDQFEELFTQCSDASERSRFIDNLVHAARVEGGSTMVVITMRADFYGRATKYPDLRDALSRQQVLVGPMAEAELREAIKRPAQAAGMNFEKGLVETILRDVADEPGALPLLQYTLFELWERRREGWLTFQAYEEMGGVRGALAYRADYTLETLNAEERDIVRRILLRLVQVGEGVADTARRAKLDELLPAGMDSAIIAAVIQKLAEARLLIASKDKQDRVTVELAHDSLIREWPRLRNWLEEDREALRNHRQLAEAAREWDQNGRDAAFLYRGSRLAMTEEWARAHSDAMTELERTFITASIEVQEREMAEREAQRQREVEQLRASTNLRRRALIAGVVAMAAVVVAMLVIFFNLYLIRNSINAEQPAAIGQAAAERAQAEATAQAEIANAALQAESVANQAAASSFSPDGTRFTTVNSDGTVTLWDAATGQAVTTFGDPGNQITWTGFRPAGRLIATGSEDGQVQLWDAVTGKLLATLSGHTDTIRKVVFSPDGRYLATASDDGTARIWDVETGKALAVLEHDGPVVNVAFSPDGSQLVTTSSDGTTRLWDAQSWELISTLVHEQ